MRGAGTLLTAAVLTVAGALRPAEAQGWADWGGVSQADNVAGAAWDGIRAGGPGAPSSFLDLAARPSDAAPEQFGFAVDEGVRAAALSEVRAMLAERPDLAGPFGSAAVFGVMAGEQERLGLSPANLADALTAHLLVVHHAANARGAVVPSATREEAARLRPQVVRALGAASGGAVPPEAALQAAADEATLRTALLLVMIGYAEEAGPEAVAELASLARTRGLESFGVDLTRAALTADGLTPLP